MQTVNTDAFRGYCDFTAKTQYWKFETNIPRKGIARPQSQFPHSCVCERFLYSHNRSACSAEGKYVDRSWEYVNCSKTHECGNWDSVRTIPFLGIHKWDFRCRDSVVKFMDLSGIKYSPLIKFFEPYFYSRKKCDKSNVKMVQRVGKGLERKFVFSEFSRPSIPRPLRQIFFHCLVQTFLCFLFYRQILSKKLWHLFALAFLKFFNFLDLCREGFIFLPCNN